MLENITVNGTEYVPKELTDSKIQFLENKYRIAMAINVTDESKLRSEIAELKKKNKEFNLQNLPFMSLADIARCHEELSDYYIKRVDNAKRVSESIKNRESFATGIGATIGKPCEELKELIKESIFGFKPLFTPMEIALMAEALRRRDFLFERAFRARTASGTFRPLA